MTDKRQKIIAGMKYVILVFIILYLIMLMVYASGSKRAFSEVEKAVSSVLNSDELTKMDERMLKKNFVLCFSIECISSGSTSDTGKK